MQRRKLLQALFQRVQPNICDFAAHKIKRERLEGGKPLEALLQRVESSIRDFGTTKGLITLVTEFAHK